MTSALNASVWLLCLMVFHPMGGQTFPANESQAKTNPSAISHQEALKNSSKGTEFRIVGYNDMDHMLEAIDGLYQRNHPDISISLSLPGTATGAGSLTLGASDLAPMGAEFSSRELGAYRAMIGQDPVQIRVAHCSLNPAARSAPVGIYVNADNPLTRLTVAQVARIFTAGQPDGDLTAWSQLIDGDAWKGLPIHTCGIAEEAAAGLSPYMLSKFGGHPYTLTFTPLPQSRDAVKCAANDPAAIAFASANIVDPKTKLLAIAETANGRYVVPSSEEIVAGNYRFDRFVYVYLRRLPGKPLDSQAKEYVLLMLSDAGQSAIAAAAPGYLPLNAEEIAVERKRLE